MNKVSQDLTWWLTEDTEAVSYLVPVLFNEVGNYSCHDQLVVKQNYSSSLIHEFSGAFTIFSLKLNISNRISADSMSLGPGLLKY